MTPAELEQIEKMKNNIADFIARRLDEIDKWKHDLTITLGSSFLYEQPNFKIKIVGSTVSISGLAGSHVSFDIVSTPGLQNAYKAFIEKREAHEKLKNYHGVIDSIKFFEENYDICNIHY